MKLQRPVTIRRIDRGIIGWLACGLALCGITGAKAENSTEVVLHHFSSVPLTGSAVGPVIRDAAGNFYGTTYLGGTADCGVVFKVNPAARETVLYRFTGLADGCGPVGGVISDSSGNLYGATETGGSTGNGVVFKLDRTGHQTVLYSFTGLADGGRPEAGLLLDPAGNLYGTASAGGSATGDGVVFKLDSAGNYTVLHTFNGDDGRTPSSGVIRDSAGNLYGTTSVGGCCFYGVVYKLDSSGNFSVLWAFTGDGRYPVGGVIQDPAGNLYGITSFSDSPYVGVVYEVYRKGGYASLYHFTGGADGGNGNGPLVIDPAGNLYGTTASGIFKLDPAGNETVLYNFQDGGGSLSFRDPSGALYGTAVESSNAGSIYKLDAAGTFTTIYGFPAAEGGSTSGVIADPGGNLYGTTGATASDGGTVYEVTPSGHNTLLHSFGNSNSGSSPEGGVIRDLAGNLYGTTNAGGAQGYGTVFKVDPAGNETVLHNFTGLPDGANPSAGLTLDAAATLYGTTQNGGASFKGTVFKIDVTGQETVLHSFTGADGQSPESSVTLDPAGNLYGTTAVGGRGYGVIFKLDTSGNVTVPHQFTNGADGGSPVEAGVILNSAGNLYGTTSGGGASGQGVVYKLTSAGLIVLHAFTGGSDGGQPQGGVIQDASGNLYGTTFSGGVTGRGVVYKLGAAGHFTILYHFTGGVDGGGPAAGVIRDAAGNLYGTTQSGGKFSSGVVFKLLAP